MVEISALNFEKLGGVIPAVVQDEEGRVLMVGFMNEEALRKTIEEKKVTFWSRTKRRLWTKGETSGHFLHLVRILSDCDGDSLLLMAAPSGPVCHRGTYTCFGEGESAREESPAGGAVQGESEEDEYRILRELGAVIQRRKEMLPEGSYTASLFREGLNKILQKFGEEAIEVILEARDGNRATLPREVADLLYHLLVLLAYCQVPFEEALEVLAGRRR